MASPKNARPSGTYDTDGTPAKRRRLILEASSDSDSFSSQDLQRGGQREKESEREREGESHSTSRDLVGFQENRDGEETSSSRDLMDPDGFEEESPSRDLQEEGEGGSDRRFIDMSTDCESRDLQEEQEEEEETPTEISEDLQEGGHRPRSKAGSNREEAAEEEEDSSANAPGKVKTGRVHSRTMPRRMPHPSRSRGNTERNSLGEGDPQEARNRSRAKAKSNREEEEEEEEDYSSANAPEKVKMGRVRTRKMPLRSRGNTEWNSLGEDPQKAGNRSNAEAESHREEEGEEEEDYSSANAPEKAKMGRGCSQKMPRTALRPCRSRGNTKQNSLGGGEADSDKTPLLSELSKEFSQGDGRRCGLCGGGSDGQPPKRIPEASRSPSRHARGPNSNDNDDDVFLKNEFGNEPGWLGPLLGPLNQEYGIAGLWIHQECAVWSPEVYFAGPGRLKNVRVALRRGLFLKCNSCGQPGATLGCRVEHCSRTYHLPCCRFEGSLFDHKKYLIACPEHSNAFLPRLSGDGTPGSGARARKAYMKKVIDNQKKEAYAAKQRDLEAEYRKRGIDGDDEEFIAREEKRLQRDLLKVSPIFVGGSNLKQGDSLEGGWESMGGLGNVVECLKEMVILPLLYPGTFEGLGITPPRGVLLHGPPGTGKTLAVRALVGACAKGSQRVAYFCRKGADCLGKYVGDAERQLRLLFQLAEMHQPSIVFFDEIDGLAPDRSKHEDQTQKSVVSTLLALMDGLKSRGSVVVIGSTNCPEALDPALRRPGRFDREILFRLPSPADRAAIISLHTRKWATPPTNDTVLQIASLTDGYAGADLQALCAQAAITALKRSISIQDMLDLAEKEGMQSLPALPPLQVKVSDWITALKQSPSPCSLRVPSLSVVRGRHAPLLRHLAPALIWQITEVLLTLHSKWQISLPPTLEKAATLVEAVLLSSPKNSLSSSLEECLRVVQKKSGSSCERNLKSFQGRSIEKALEDALFCAGMVSDMDSVPLDTNLPKTPFRGTRFCVLVSSSSANGQSSTVLTNWILYGFENQVEIRKLSLAAMAQEGCGDIIQGLLRILGEVRNACPCILVMPQIESWAIIDDGASQCWSLFVQQVNLMPPSLPIVLLASSGVQKAMLPSEIVRFFTENDSESTRGPPINRGSLFPTVSIEMEGIARIQAVLRRASEAYAKFFSHRYLCKLRGVKRRAIAQERAHHLEEEESSHNSQRVAETKESALVCSSSPPSSPCTNLGSCTELQDEPRSQEGDTRNGHRQCHTVSENGSGGDAQNGPWRFHTVLENGPEGDTQNGHRWFQSVSENGLGGDTQMGHKRSHTSLENGLGGDIQNGHKRFHTLSENGPGGNIQNGHKQFCTLSENGGETQDGHNRFHTVPENGLGGDTQNGHKRFYTVLEIGPGGNTQNGHQGFHSVSENGPGGDTQNRHQQFHTVSENGPGGDTQSGHERFHTVSENGAVGNTQNELQNIHSVSENGPGGNTQNGHMGFHSVSENGLGGDIQSGWLRFHTVSQNGPGGDTQNGHWRFHPMSENGPGGDTQNGHRQFHSLSENGPGDNTPNGHGQSHTVSGNGLGDDTQNENGRFHTVLENGPCSPQQRALQNAIAICGYELLQHPELAGLRYATWKLRKGPYFRLPKKRKGYRRSDDTTTSEASVIKGLAAVGFLAMRGFYPMAEELAFEVRRILGHLYERINLKRRISSRLLHLASQAAALEDRVFAWVHHLPRLEENAILSVRPSLPCKKDGLVNKHEGQQDLLQSQKNESLNAVVHGSRGGSLVEISSTDTTTGKALKHGDGGGSSSSPVFENNDKEWTNKRKRVFAPATSLLLESHKPCPDCLKQLEQVFRKMFSLSLEAKKRRISSPTTTLDDVNDAIASCAAAVSVAVSKLALGESLRIAYKGRPTSNHLFCNESLLCSCVKTHHKLKTIASDSDNNNKNGFDRMPSSQLNKIGPNRDTIKTILPRQEQLEAPEMGPGTVFICLCPLLSSLLERRIC